MSKIFKFESVIGLDCDRMYASKEKLLEDLEEKLIDNGAAVLLNDAIESGMIKIIELDLE